ncbi:hypothetical protein EUAN_04740 [Andreesenia angusta]|uniref:Prepilin-type N-terminal cleavage/methylation domain-containing protein n=1 Tax=Andreesenia angusta TaxID=39480 RepID=A0A1S1V8H1_9FIRM|nr:prepilin-type N-terminal cleavage/methylation domain-containing protein [Andreesenia angusta]OHW62690.1 hypothetical protein EUAN_04740 [Andreesenia angusta]
MDNRGRTLMELVITIAIIAILSTVGISRYMGMQEMAKVSADEALASELARVTKVYLARSDDKIIWPEKGIMYIELQTLVDEDLVDGDIKIQSIRYSKAQNASGMGKPGNSGNAPGQANKPNTPGNSENAPGQNKDVEDFEAVEISANRSYSVTVKFNWKQSYPVVKSE